MSGIANGVAPLGSKAHRAWWLALASVGAALVFAGTFLPFAHLTLSNGFAFSRTDWQLGANSSVTFGGAPLLLIDVAVVLLGFFSVEGVLGTARTVSGRRTSLVFQFWMLIWLASGLKSTFPGTWTDVPGTTVTRGLGGWVSALGVVVLMGTYVVEVRRYGLVGSFNLDPLDDKERETLARADRRPVLRTAIPFIGGAFLALAMRYAFGASWPSALIMFAGISGFYWWRYSRRLANLRRRSDLELNRTSSTTR
ncbi:MAG: hypothetical protein ACYC1I_00655 [Acidimicrobiales bacterium]